MRISTRANDVGYIVHGGTYAVTVNGKEALNCFLADDVLGEAHCYSTDGHGSFLIDNDKQSIQETVLKGVVNITLI